MAKKLKTQKKTATEKRLEAEGWVELDSESELYKEVDAHLRVNVESARSERIGVRLDPHDLKLLKAMAEQRGIGYQTLLGSVLHMFVTHQLVDQNATQLNSIDARLRELEARVNRKSAKAV